MNFLYISVGFALAVAAFIVWRILSVPMGMRKRDARLLPALDPIAQRLTEGKDVSPDEVLTLARQPQYRYLLYSMLKSFSRTDLFPPEYTTLEAQGAGLLAYWMMHPNELQDAPAEIELLEEVERERSGERAKFLVYRYRMAPGHWAEKDGWLLGLAGPFVEVDEPYSGRAGAFSRCNDREGQIHPSELVDWYVGLSAAKGK